MQVVVRRDQIEFDQLLATYHLIPQIVSSWNVQSLQGLGLTYQQLTEDPFGMRTTDPDPVSHSNEW
jgi:hypothetical protein